MDRDLLTAAQAAAELQVSLRSLGRLIDDGEIQPEMKLPGVTGARLFTRAEIARVKQLRAVKAA